MQYAPMPPTRNCSPMIRGTGPGGGANGTYRPLIHGTMECLAMLAASKHYAPHPGCPAQQHPRSLTSSSTARTSDGAPASLPKDVGGEGWGGFEYSSAPMGNGTWPRRGTQTQPCCQGSSPTYNMNARQVDDGESTKLAQCN